MRNLLPYEHALIDALGITEEEYFAFRKAQREYKDPKAGTILDVRGGLEVGTVALVLSIVGTIAQVASALLAPRPEGTEAAGSTRPRDRRFAPRYGFDSLQDLAQYGDPVNLVYTNKGSGDFQNATGGVRVNTSLLWSAVYSLGNTQYIQMMAAIGASDIESISYPDTAVGQTLIRLFTRSSAWVYFRNKGPIIKTDRKLGNAKDPFVLDAAGSDNVYAPLITATDRKKGYSQAFSPSSASEFGITAPIPVKLNVFARNEDGQEVKDPLNIEMQNRGAYWPALYNGTRPLIPIGKQMKLSIQKAKEEKSDNEADSLSNEIRYAMAESIEFGSFYKLGSAKFQVVDVAGDVALDRENLTATIECVEAGYGPWEDYGTEDTYEEVEELETERRILEDQLDPANPNSLVYKLSSLSTSDYFLFAGTTSSWTERRARLLERVRVKRDQMEDLYDAIVSYKRNKSQMDELVLAAENKIPGRQFSQAVIDLAKNISDKEEDIEKARDQKERINGNIERLGSTNERQKNLTETKKIIATYKKELKSLRSELAAALREYGVAEGTISTQIRTANALRNDLKQEFRSEFTVNGVLNPVYEKIFGQVDPIWPDLTTDDPKAGRERRILRKLKNVFAKIENLLLSLGSIDYDAFNRRRTTLETQIATARTRLAVIVERLKNPNTFNDYLGTKCLTKVVTARYETLSAIDLVHFALKARVFMRIQGRASKYADTKVEKYKDADNGYKPRTAMFMVYYRNASTTTQAQRDNDEGWISPNVIFCVRRTFDKDIFFPFAFKPPSTAQSKWEFKFEPVFDASSEALKKGTALDFVYLETRGSVKTIQPQSSAGGIFYCRGYRRNPKANSFNLPAKNKSPFGVDEWSIYSVRSDTSIQFSFDAGVEFKITAVSEQQFENPTTELYQHMATIGLNAYSSAGLANVRNLSVLVNKGKRVRNISVSSKSFPDQPDGASCFAPDIFLDTILDGVNGIGQYLDANLTASNVQALVQDRVDIPGLALAKSFCNKNKYYMDGVIADKTSWRSFWSEVAPYSLLELARIGGKETLIPAVPTAADGSRTRNISISALFNQGNILEGSYKEEFLDYGDSAQDIIATIVYRDQSGSQPFPRNTSVTVQLIDTVESIASRRTFDLSNFVTNRNQAIDYAKLMVQQQRHSRRAIEFQTFPVEAPMAPGSYIYVQVDDNSWDNIQSGSVLDDGSINIPFSGEAVNGTFPTLIYEPGKPPVKRSIAYANGQSSTLAAYAGTGALFVLGSEVSSKRVFRVVEVAMGEEGEVSVKAVEHPCVEEAGQTKSLIARFDDSLYKIS
jgi:hypothetical protein